MNKRLITGDVRSKTQGGRKKDCSYREVAAHLEIDISKMELTLLWLSDSMYLILKDEAFRIQALNNVKKRSKKLEYN